MKYLFALLVVLNFSVEASSKYFEIGDIEVKQKGVNSLSAKQSALGLAARLAFKKLIEVELLKKFPESISNHNIQSCVYDWSINKEKFSNSIYIGKFSYRFSKRKVAELLKSYGIDVPFKPDESNNYAKLVVYFKDFLLNAKNMQKLKLKIIVERFSNEKVIFLIDRNRINSFRKLRMKYAQLST